MGNREKQIFLALLIAAGITFLLSSFNFFKNYTVTIPARGGNYSEGMIGQPRFINPILASTPTDQAIVNLVYAGLYKFDGQGNVVPQLASDFPEISEDETKYTVKIRDGAFWHNGIPVTAQDVAFTIETIKNPEYKSPRQTDWLSTTVEVVDERTITFTIQSPSGLFLNNLTHPLLSKSLWGTVPPEDFILSQSNIEAIGNGPYRIKEVKKLAQSDNYQSITLESFRDYPEQPAFISNIKLFFYDSGEELLKDVHGKKITGFGFSQFEDRVSVEQSGKDLTIHQIPLPQYQAAFFNTTNPALGDARVRSGLNLATDAGAILEEIYNNQGLLIDSPILAQQVENLPETTSRFNAKEAGAVLNQAGWTLEVEQNIRTKNGRELAFTLATNDTPVNVRTAELIKEQWDAIGVRIDLNILPTKELTETVIKPRNYDILLFAQKLGADPDPFIFWHSSQVKDPGLNLSNYDNQAMDTFITEARKAADKATRDQIYIQMHEVFKQDLPAIFLVQTVYTYALSDDIKGFSIQSLINESTRSYNIPYWYLNTKRVLK